MTVDEAIAKLQALSSSGRGKLELKFYDREFLEFACLDDFSVKTRALGDVVEVPDHVEVQFA